MKNQLIGLVVVVIVVIIVLVGQNRLTKEAGILGVIAPLSGQVASMGEGIKRSIDLAELQNLEVVYEDDQCDSKRAISAYQLLKSRGAKYFYAACSGTVLALAPLVKQNNDLLITAYAGSSEIRSTGDEVIRFIPDALSITEVINEYIRANPTKKFGLLNENQDYAKSAADSIISASGSRIVLRDSYNSADISFKTILTKFKTSAIDSIIWIPTSDKAAQIILKEMQELALNKELIGEVNLCDYPFSPADFGIHGVCWKAQLSTDGSTNFLNSFKEKYGVESQYQFYDAVTYDSVKILDSFAAKHGNEVAKVKADILKGVTGDVSSYSFEPNGEVREPGKYLREVRF